MRFELSVALSYLLPRARTLSTSLISLVSILVISLVVWLVVVFLSVTHGIEKKWIEELVALNAPLRVTPKEEYFKTYYYQIDALSEQSNYSFKTLGEKVKADKADPFDPSYDATLPLSFPQPLVDGSGTVKDIAKEAWTTLTSLNLKPQEFEVSFSNLQLDLYREENIQKNVLNQLSYVSSYDGQNKRLQHMILPPTPEDLTHLKGALSSFEAGVSTEKLCIFQENKEAICIPARTPLGEGILLSKSFQKHGVLMGDRGHLSYLAPGASAVKEQRLPVFVAGFYDPGVMPIGNRVVFADPSLLMSLRSQLSLPDEGAGNGFNIYLDDLSQTDALKAQIQKDFETKGIDAYFTVESFSDYEFAKPVLEQLKSDKTLFTLIAIIILIVACSNIISMLILLVNDKKKEIGILQSMGVSRRQIALIFGMTGCFTGLISSLVGTLAAVYTLHNLHVLVNFLSFLQGREAFQTLFYGEGGLPNEVSMNALAFVLIATTLISLLAGIIPAIKAAKLKPAAILRSE